MSLREIRPQTSVINKKEDPDGKCRVLFFIIWLIQYRAFGPYSLLGFVRYFGLSGICPEFGFVQYLSLSGIRFCPRNNTSRRQKSRN